MQAHIFTDTRNNVIVLGTCVFKSSAYCIQLSYYHENAFCLYIYKWYMHKVVAVVFTIALLHMAVALERWPQSWPQLWALSE